MKIALLTFSEFKDNYGQILQAFALQEYLSKRGHEVAHIKYTRNKIIDHKSHRKRNTLSSRLRAFIVQHFFVPYRQYLNTRFRKKYPVSFERFEKNNIRFYDEVYDCIEDFFVSPPQAECYICGSDQIWNTGATPNSKAYYLDFGDKSIQRISYAPSFGRPSISEIDEPFYIKQLSHLNKISVREKEGVEICKRMGYDATCVIDPTFLLEREDYLKLCGNISMEVSDVFCYFLNFRSAKEVHWKQIKKYCHESGLTYDVTLSSGAYPAMPLLGDVPYKSFEPQEWIYVINNCRYMITNSFHGLAFAIILNKPFIVMPLSGSAAKMNGRIMSLLSLLKLENRLYDPGKSIDNQLANPIEWTTVNSIIKTERKKSAVFLGL